MTVFRAAAVSAAALLAVMSVSAPASAEHLFGMRMLWPRIYAPHVPYSYRYYDDQEEAYYDDEDEDVYIPRRRHRDRNVYLYDDSEEDLAPVYEPPVKKTVKPKAKKKVVTVKPTKDATRSVAVVKPKVKPAAKSSPIATASLATGTSENAITTKAPVATTALKSTSAVVSTANASAKPEVVPVVVKTAPPAPVKVATAASPTAKAAAPAGAIGCSKGAEIVSGYGFTSVKPRACTGATYTFDATRAANAYLIKVAATTGEITDVQKLK